MLIGQCMLLERAYGLVKTSLNLYTLARKL